MSDEQVKEPHVGDIIWCVNHSVGVKEIKVRKGVVTKEGNCRSLLEGFTLTIYNEDNQIIKELTNFVFLLPYLPLGWYYSREKAFNAAERMIIHRLDISQKNKDYYKKEVSVLQNQQKRLKIEREKISNTH